MLQKWQGTIQQSRQESSKELIGKKVCNERSTELGKKVSKKSGGELGKKACELSSKKLGKKVWTNVAKN